MTTFWFGVLLTSIILGFIAYLLNENRKDKIQQTLDQITLEENSIEKTIDNSSLEQLVDENNKSPKS